MNIEISILIDAIKIRLRHVLTYSLVVLLVACGGNTERSAESNRTALAATIISSDPELTVTALTKVSEVRVNRTVYDYVFKVTVRNNGNATQNAVSATLQSAGLGTTIIDGNVLVGSLPPLVSKTSADTITLRVDRTVPFDQNALRWEINSENLIPVPGIFLPGDPNALAADYLKEYDAQSPLGLQTAIAPDSDSVYYTSILTAIIRSTATVEDVNSALRSVDGRIIRIFEGSAVVTIQIPNPGSLENLERIATKLQGTVAFEGALSVFIPEPDQLPDNVSPASSVNSMGPIYHQLAARLAPAWNAVNLYTSKSKVEVIVVDFFGNGAATEINQLAPPSGFTTGHKCSQIINRVRSELDCFHGYLVLGVLDGSFGGDNTETGMVTGALPKDVKVNIIDLAAMPATKTTENFIIEQLGLIFKSSSASRYVLSMSIGDPRQNLVPARSVVAANAWRKLVRKIPNVNYEAQVIQVTSAGNNRANTLAQNHSWWNAAVLLGTLEKQSSLTNGLVVENRTVATINGVISPGPRNLSSTIGGNVGAIGTNVFSFSGPRTARFWSDGGTSSATPQVAGLAAYMEMISETLPTKLSVQEIISRIRSANYKPDGIPTPAIDAYASMLSLDSGLNASFVRLAILQPTIVSPAVPKKNFAFDDALLFLQAFFPMAYGLNAPAPAQQNFSRFDLNGDGYTGGSRTYPFKLDSSTVAFGMLRQYPNGISVNINESAVTDFEILCYYVNSKLYDFADLGKFNMELQNISKKLGHNVSCAVAPPNTAVITNWSCTAIGNGNFKVNLNGIANSTEPLTKDSIMTIFGESENTVVVTPTSTTDCLPWTSIVTDENGGHYCRKILGDPPDAAVESSNISSKSGAQAAWFIMNYYDPVLRPNGGVIFEQTIDIDCPGKGTPLPNY